MPISLHNSLSRAKELFTPMDAEHVRMYVCGPTVYDRAHIGNARAVVVFDMLYRLLQYTYAQVTYARNITDVDDKINARAKETGKPISEITTETTRMFHEDMEALSCLPPTVEPRATQHIPQMIAMIERLIASGHAYAAEGHVLFAVQSDPNYGHLAGRTTEEMIAGARVEIAPYKKYPGDFVLWKPSKGDEPGWESPWGVGRPGWHIECSAMSTEYLGNDFDIHGGGADLQFPHHENEIAQSCCANPGSRYAKYWVHNGFLTVNGEKMSKSLGNFVTVHELLARGIKGEVIRYALLATHYRKPLDFSDKALEDAKKALDRFYRVIQGKENAEVSVPAPFIEALSDDINTPKALALLHEYAQGGRAKDLLAGGIMLGFFEDSAENWFADENQEVNDEEKTEIDALVAARAEAKQAKNWSEADRIRDLLAQRGIVLEDRPSGVTEWRRG
ncbi:MAG: cysS [Rickettsiales bacterium]|jgi:cysteinyl-tRNA synthetase|nr:cysS [Rickettsiales bacterium]